MQLLLIAMALGAAPDVAVVCPEAMRPALGAWVDYRQGQGHVVEVLSSEGDAKAVRERIVAAARGGALKHLLLVGDTTPIGRDRQPSLPLVPAPYVKAAINVKYGSEPTIASDNVYADLDGDGMPDLTVGRLPCDTPEELTALVKRIIAYESSQDFGPWRRRVNFVAGAGGFGPLADATLEITARKLITTLVPPSYDATMTYASWTSAYCPAPGDMSLWTRRRLEEGCLFFVYLGHGSPYRFDALHTPEGDHDLLAPRDVARLQSAQGSPIALLMACYTGAFDAPHDCLAEEMLRAPGGPVAVFAGSRVTMPYAMTVLASEMTAACFASQPGTLGEAILKAKRSSVGQGTDPALRQSLDLVAKLISPNASELEAERREHVQLFNLLGDPLLRLPTPAQVSLKSAALAAPGDSLAIELTTPISGECMIEFVTRRDQPSADVSPRSKYPQDASALTAMSARYQQANELVIARRQQTVEVGTTTTEIPIVTTCSGPCHVRVFVRGTKGFAMGSADVQIKKPKAE